MNRTATLPGLPVPVGSAEIHAWDPRPHGMTDPYMPALPSANAKARRYWARAALTERARALSGGGLLVARQMYLRALESELGLSGAP